MFKLQTAAGQAYKRGALSPEKGIAMIACLSITGNEDGFQAVPSVQSHATTKFSGHSYMKKLPVKMADCWPVQGYSGGTTFSQFGWSFSLSITRFTRIRPSVKKCDC
eukprot:472101-Pelagomonas_calceolata.AAC.1